MQQNQPGRHFSETKQQQPVYRFPQNQQAQGWQPQQNFTDHADEEIPMRRKDRRELNRAHGKKRRRIFTLWNLFAVIGIITVIVEAMRFVVIPLLVYLEQILSGGAV